MTSISAAIAGVLRIPDPRAKVMRARAVARDWRLGRFEHSFDVAMPAQPTRPDKPELISATRMPKRGRAGSMRTRIALLHSLAHIEFSAIDLAFDMAGRFGDGLPRAFIDDWLTVGAEEAMHFAILDRRLRDLGSFYGALPAHAGLWEAAESTARDTLARLAVVPMVLEARGLDVTPAMIARFHKVGDTISARLLDRIYRDEVKHVATGVRWFTRLSIRSRNDPPALWRHLVKIHFGGNLKPPFNDSARTAAGLTKDFYGDLADA